ncbi:MAG: TonB-dependent receptor plug domain-containing protein [Ignavibacteriales bacterium]|nr:MAG: TonB-dependent receptor plug domain-containing protein [Ignavibacteriales bacterium]
MKNLQFNLLCSLMFITMLMTSASAIAQNGQPGNDSLSTVHTDTLSILTDSTSNSIMQDSTLLVEVKDSIIIFYGNPFLSESTILSYAELMNNDYRYTGDFFKLSAFSFTKDFGFIGQNNETMIYGTGFEGISYFEDGVLLNNRSLNQLDLNNVPSELIDSIEILPAVRGFFYGSFNNPVSVNFITKDKKHSPAYSRIKYYEGPFGEAMIDGIVSTNPFKRLSLYFEASNRKADRRYLNSSSSSWLGRIKLKYFLNDFLNLQASYGYVKSTKGLNGGVLIDSIGNTTNLVSIMYNEVLAPVKFSERSYDVKQHHFGLRALSEIGDFTKTDLNLYYKFSLEELNNSQAPHKIAEDIKDKTLGINLRQVFTRGNFDVELNGTYESINYLNREYFQVDTLPVSITDFYFKSKNYSTGGIVSFKTLNHKLKFSAFGKMTGREYDYTSELNNLIGYGFDVVFKPSERIKLYAGYSYFEPQLYAENISTFEASLNYAHDNISAGVHAFLRKSEIIYSPVLNRDQPDIFNPYQDMTGIAITVKSKFWKLVFEGRGASYSGSSDSFDLYNLPKQNLVAGIYFNDLLFDSNLDLKTGFVYYFTGEQDLFNFTVPASSKLDFTVAGEIQKTAIAYFTWENLLGEEYFIVPYYPMPLRGIRFGVAWEFLN